MSANLIHITNKVDFCFTITCFITIVVKTFIMRKRIFRDKLMIVDWVTIMFSVADFVYCALNKYDVVDNETVASRVLRSIKILRILRIIYWS